MTSLPHCLAPTLLPKQAPRRRPPHPSHQTTRAAFKSRAAKAPLKARRCALRVPSTASRISRSPNSPRSPSPYSAAAAHAHRRVCVPCQTGGPPAVQARHSAPPREIFVSQGHSSFRRCRWGGVPGKHVGVGPEGVGRTEGESVFGGRMSPGSFESIAGRRPETVFQGPSGELGRKGRICCWCW